MVCGAGPDVGMGKAWGFCLVSGARWAGCNLRTKGGWMLEMLATNEARSPPATGRNGREAQLGLGNLEGQARVAADAYTGEGLRMGNWQAWVEPKLLVTPGYLSSAGRISAAKFSTAGEVGSNEGSGECEKSFQVALELSTPSVGSSFQGLAKGQVWLKFCQRPGWTKTPALA